MAKEQNKAKNFKKKKKETDARSEMVHGALVASLGPNLKDIVAINQKHVEQTLALITPGMLQAQAFIERTRGAVAQAQRIQLEMQKIYRDILKPFIVNKTEVYLSAPLHRPGFPILDSDIKAIAERFAEIFISKTKGGQISNRILLTLTKEGDLYRTDDRSRCYRMHREAARVKILRYLLGLDTFKASKIIQRETGCPSYSALTNAIGRINAKARSELQLSKGDSNRLIISKPYNGYMVNPLYVIME